MYNATICVTSTHCDIYKQDINYVFDNANSWIENEFPLRKMNDVRTYEFKEKLKLVRKQYAPPPAPPV